MPKEVFNRYEVKYKLDTDTYKSILKLMKDNVEADKYNKDGCFYTISNIYYDTDDNHLIQRSLDKPIYKQKLRLRGYGIPGQGDIVFLEIKKKVNGIVNKRRTSIELFEAYEYLETKIKPEYKSYMNTQVLNEIDYLIHIYDLKPALYLAYDRMAYFDKDDPNLRISFDTNIRSRRENLRLEEGDFGTPLVENNEWLMEVKSGQSIPKWLSDILCDLKIYPSSFSKYGTEYFRYINNAFTLPRKEKGEMKICSNNQSAHLIPEPDQLPQTAQ